MGEIAIAYCHTGAVRHCFHAAMCATVARRAELGVKRIITAGGLFPDDGRNLNARDFLAGDEEWMLCIDTDIAFAPEDILALSLVAEQLGPCIAAGVFLTPIPLEVEAGVVLKVLPTWWTPGTERGLGRGTQVVEIPERTDPVVELWTVGMAFTIIHRTVLEGVEAAYCHDVDWPMFGRDLIEGRRAGEDVTFCHRAREQGFRVWGVPSVRVGHEKMTLLVP